MLKSPSPKPEFFDEVIVHHPEYFKAESLENICIQAYFKIIDTFLNISTLLLKILGISKNDYLEDVIKSTQNMLQTMLKGFPKGKSKEHIRKTANKRMSKSFKLSFVTSPHENKQANLEDATDYCPLSKKKITDIYKNFPNQSNLKDFLDIFKLSQVVKFVCDCKILESFLYHHKIQEFSKLFVECHFLLQDGFTKALSAGKNLLSIVNNKNNVSLQRKLANQQEISESPLGSNFLTPNAKLSRLNRSSKSFRSITAEKDTDISTSGTHQSKRTFSMLLIAKPEKPIHKFPILSPRAAERKLTNIKRIEKSIRKQKSK